jgi:hypothetical protein
VSAQTGWGGVEMAVVRGEIECKKETRKVKKKKRKKRTRKRQSQILKRK